MGGVIKTKDEQYSMSINYLTIYDIALLHLFNSVAI